MQGVVAVLILVAGLGGAGTALVALWLQSSLFQAFLAYLIGGLGLITLILVIIWARAKATSGRYLPRKIEQETAGSLVFPSAETDLEDRVNVNRTMRPDTLYIQVSEVRRRLPSLAARLAVGLSFLLALVAIDQT